MPISNDLLSTTLYSIRDSEVDALFKRNTFLAHAKRAGGTETEDGGTRIQRPIAVYEHSSISQFTSGYEPLDLGVSDIMEPASYHWCDYAAPIVITKKEETENSGEKAIVKILEARTKSVLTMLQRRTNRQILAGDSTALTNLNTLNGAVGGFIEAAAPGAQVNTVGGLSKAALDVRGWYNQAETAGGDFSTNGLNAMHNLYTKATSISPDGKLDAIIASEPAFVNYKRSLQQLERYMDQKALDGGRMVLMYNGAPVEQDLDMPVNTLDTDDFSMYFLNFSGIKIVFHKDGDFAPSQFVDGQGNLSKVSHIYTKLQLIADHLGSVGVLYAGNTY